MEHYKEEVGPVEHYEEKVRPVEHCEEEVGPMEHEESMEIVQPMKMGHGDSGMRCQCYIIKPAIHDAMY